MMGECGPFYTVKLKRRLRIVRFLNSYRWCRGLGFCVIASVWHGWRVSR